MTAGLFHPIVDRWFQHRFTAPTEPQQRGWPEIAAGRDTLIAAPTGSGKTLAAFLICIDRLVRRSLAGGLDDRTRVVYVSPLKALGNDIQRNLEQPLAEILALCPTSSNGDHAIRTAVRTGDTPASQRQAMLRRPPHILVTTPESLYLLLTAEKGRELLRDVETVIVDEIHALARDKRGSHLALSLARLDALCDQPPARVGLSATQKPIDEIARFLVGTPNVDGDGAPQCSIIDVGHARQLDLNIEVPPTELEAVCSNEQWAQVYGRLMQLIAEHRSTLIFVNTRRLAERVAHHLTEQMGADAVASHHGSLSRQLRQSAEARLKAGTLKAIVATASLEMGIDVGFIDLVCQIGSPRSIATLLQRVGRSGHSLGALPRGRMFPLTRDELLECLALIRGVRRGRLDAIEPPVAPLDILAQQIVAAVASEEWSEDDLFDLCRRAWPYRELKREDFDAVVELLSNGITPGLPRGKHLHRDAISGRLRARRGARITALTSGGAIPETAQYRVVTEPEGVFVGQLDEDFAIESMAGDIFVLGNTSWQIRRIRGGEVLVHDAGGAPPSIPFWFGEAPGRTVELSAEVSELRSEVAALLPEELATSEALDDHWELPACEWIEMESGVSNVVARQAVAYIAAQAAAIGLVPTGRRIVFERFFDESGGMQIVIHAPLGARINRAWGLALRKRFCRSFDFELQASADDDGIVLSLGPQHSFALDDLFGMLNTGNARYLIEQALLAVPMFQVRWRWNVTRALAVLRQRGGKKVPPYLQRFQSDDLLAAVFPETVGCLENHEGDVEIPDHPLVRQTMHDCLHEAMDVDRWIDLLTDVQQGRVELIARDTREPSPFSHELLNANPYAFLDGAALEERRTRAVVTRRSLSVDELRDLGRLDPAAIDRVVREAAPVVRDADELHDALLNMVVLTEAEGRGWREWMEQLIGAGRATRLRRDNAVPLWIAAENWPLVSSLWPEAAADPAVSLPASLDVQWESAKAVVDLIRGRMAYAGPTTAARLSALVGLRTSQVAAALTALEGEGTVLRGQFRQGQAKPSSENGAASDEQTEWCDRRLLARIHRLTLDGLRKSIEPVSPEAFVRFLIRRHHLEADDTWGGPVAVREAIHALQGFEFSAGAWETPVLASRVHDYDPAWLDQLFQSGEVMWGRLCPPVMGENGSRRGAAMTRAVPITLLLRDDLPWLLPPERRATAEAARPAARAVWELLSTRGALFMQELCVAAEMLPGHLEEALRELAALGLVTCDGFQSVRQIVAGKGSRATLGRRWRPRGGKPAQSGPGRWSCFPGFVQPAGSEAYLEPWCRQLLRRWGVVFRDLMRRETAAPAWHRLVPMFRTLERRGEIRGGRFVAGTSGEQYALPAAVEQLRAVRDPGENGQWIAVSGCDPLNLVGIVTADEDRIPATSRSALILDNGRCVAVRRKAEVVFRQQVAPEQAAEMARALHQARRPTATRLHVPRGMGSSRV